MTEGRCQLAASRRQLNLAVRFCTLTLPRVMGWPCLQVVAFSDMPKKGVSAVRWGSRAASLLVGAADHKLRVLGSAP
jgi:hypothetical protein